MGTITENQQLIGVKDESNSINSLPCPFANQSSVQTSNEITAIPSSNIFHHQYHLQGYRGNFDINQQKLTYQQRKQAEFNQRQHQSPYQRHHKANSQAHSRSYQNNQRSFEQNVRKNMGQFQQHQQNDSNSFWCDACERGFPTEFSLNEHIHQHEKCCFDGCSFEGYAELLKKHIEMQHDSGLFQKINKVETEEDIERWREERRKRYPSKENVELRRLAQEAKRKRGERLTQSKKKFGDKRERRGMHNHNQAEGIERPVDNNKTKRNNRLRRRKPHKPNTNQNKVVNRSNECEKAEIEPELENVTRFKGISILEEKEEVPTPAKTSNALTSLMAFYGSSDLSEEEEDEIVEDVFIKSTDATQSENADIIERRNSAQMSETGLRNSEQVNAEIDSDDEPPEEQLIQKQLHHAANSTVQTATETSLAAETEIDKDQISDDEPPQEQSTQKQPQEEITGFTVPNSKPIDNSHKRPSTSKRVTQKTTLTTKTERVRKQNTLLEKLLQDEIRHERNVLLQCVRYVVENHFFGVGQSSGN